MRTMKIREKSLALPAGLALAALLAFAPLAGAQVCVPTADDLVFDQMTFIAALDLPGGIQNMLYVKLQDALVGIAEGDVEAAVAALEDFSNKVENQSGRQIDAADADLMLAAAESLYTPASINYDKSLRRHPGAGTYRGRVAPKPTR